MIYSNSTEILPERIVSITFDDGYENNYIECFPVIEKYSLPATIYLTTGYIDSNELFWWDKLRIYLEISKKNVLKFEKLSFNIRRKYGKKIANRKISSFIKKLETQKREEIMDKIKFALEIESDSSINSIKYTNDKILTWEQIKDMKKSNVEFAAHTINHVILPLVTIDEVKHEIIGSKMDIEKELNTPIVHFAYPNGDYCNQIKDILFEVGFQTGVTATGTYFDQNADPLILPRISIGKDNRLPVFTTKISGLWSAIFH